MGRYAAAVARFAALLVAAAVGLRVLDAVPRSITGLPRGAQRVAALSDLPAERTALVDMPAYFPDHLEWPPRDILEYAGGSLSVTIRHRTTLTPWLIVAARTEADGRLGIPVLPAVEALQTSEALVHGTSVAVTRGQDRDGAIWHQVEWPAGEVRHVMRYRGSFDELMRLVASRLGRSPR